MYQSRILAPKQLLRNHTLAIAVGVELYRARRYNANEIWAKAFEKGPPSFDSVNGGEELKCFVKME
jgi:hypothetical protein